MVYSICNLQHNVQFNVCVFVCVSLTGLSIQPHDLRVSKLQLSTQQEVALQNQAAGLTHHRPVLRLH